MPESVSCLFARLKWSLEVGWDLDTMVVSRAAFGLLPPVYRHCPTETLRLVFMCMSLKHLGAAFCIQEGLRKYLLHSILVRQLPQPHLCPSQLWFKNARDLLNFGSKH